MKRCSHLFGVLLLTAVAAMCAQSASEPKPPKAHKAPAAPRKELRPAAWQSPGARNPEAPKVAARNA